MAQPTKHAHSYAVWATAWGPMGAAASERGVCRVVLPHYQADELAELLAWEYPQARPDEAAFAELAGLSRDYFNGRVADFSALTCDLPPPQSFTGKVFIACRTIPYGQTRSYQTLAEMIAKPESARAVAAALGRNPLPLIVPCHRVTYAGGRIGGFSCPGGTELKEKMLRLERSHCAC